MIFHTMKLKRAVYSGKTLAKDHNNLQSRMMKGSHQAEVILQRTENKHFLQLFAK